MVPESELLFRRPTADEVLADLTEFFFTEKLQRQSDRELRQRKKVIQLLGKRSRAGRLRSEDIADLLQESPVALNALISILGISQERFLGILALKRGSGEDPRRPMAITAVRSAAQRDREFALMLAALLLNGKDDPDLAERLPPFDLQKLDGRKLLLRRDALVDSLLRIGLKGRYDAKKGAILEDRIEEVLRHCRVRYLRAETRVPGLSRDLDFIIPSVDEPYVLVESGLFETTARELSDKGRVEAFGLAEIEKRYPNARFVRVTDGIGWRRRGGQDLQKLIDASHYFLVAKTLPKLADIVQYHVPRRFFKR